MSIKLKLHHGPGNQRNSEGSFATLSDGRIMFAYSRYRGDNWVDEARADIAARYSSDDGKTWCDCDEIIISNEGKCNVMSVSLLRLNDGRLALFYCRKNSSNDCRMWMRTSKNDGKNWSKATCCMPGLGYYVVNNDRVIQLKNDRIIIPAALHANKKAPSHKSNSFGDIDYRAIAMFFYSDDGGETWDKLPDSWGIPVFSKTGLQEPGIVELKKGKIYAWARTDTGCQWEMYGRKNGDIIAPPQPSKFRTYNESPLSMKRIERTGDLLAVWCDRSRKWNTSQRMIKLREKNITVNWGRTPLACAISQDDGKTWIHHQLIENDPKRGFCYTAIHFVKDAVLLAYCCGGEYPDGSKSVVLQDSCIRRIDLSWFYE